MIWQIPEIAAASLNINPVTFRKYLREGRVAGAQQVKGKKRNLWVVPADLSIKDIDIPIAGRPSKHRQDTLIAKPEKPITKTLAKIEIDGNTVKVLFPERRDDFGELAKRLGYIWQIPYWEREIKPRFGTVVDRAAELGRHLLFARFCVVFPSPMVREKALAGDYNKDNRRWVLVVGKGEHKNWFAFEWPRQDDLYDKAMKIHGAQYGKPYVVVPPEQYEEVLDFAQTHKFHLSQPAQRLIEQIKAMWARALVVNITELDVEPDEVEIALDTPTEAKIDDEFADDAF